MFNDEKIEVKLKTMVKKVTDKTIEAEWTKPDGSKGIETIPYGLLVWATGNALRPLVKDLMMQIPEQKDSRRGLAVDEYLNVKGTKDIWAVGDCAIANYAPTAQVAAQEGNFLARYFNTMAKTESLQAELESLKQDKARGVESEQLETELKTRERRLSRVKQISPFKYTHQGSLAYIGSERAVADITWMDGNFASGGSLTYLFWRSAYLSMCFSSK